MLSDWMQDKLKKDLESGFVSHSGDSDEQVFDLTKIQQTVNQPEKMEETSPRKICSPALKLSKVPQNFDHSRDGSTQRNKGETPIIVNRHRFAPRFGTLPQANPKSSSNSRDKISNNDP